MAVSSSFGAPRRVWIALGLALVVGLLVRRWALDKTDNIRSIYNQQNAFFWGDRIVRGARPPGGATGGSVGWGALWRSYVAVYDDDAVHPAPEGHTLDYAPLRLLMAGVWVNHVNAVYGPAPQWRPEFARSYAGFSTVMELAGAAAMFWLVGSWMGRERDSKLSGDEPRYDGRNHPHRNPLPECRERGSERWGRWNLAAAAAILLWLDPSGIADSQVCPQGESWIYAAYLLAVLAMTRGRCFVAGMLLGIGAMLKGQILLVAPALILWPLFDRRWAASARVAAGIVAGMCLIAWPWITHGSFAWARAAFAAHVKSNDLLRKGQSMNLSAVLARWGHFTLHQPVVSIGHRVLLDVKSALLLLYGVLLVFCARATARQARSGDPRLLLSAAVPWALMFFVLGQMDERYAVWGACLGATAVVAGRWQLAGHLMLSLAATAMVIEGRLMLTPGPHPHLLWALLRLNPLTALFTFAGVGILAGGSLPGPRTANPQRHSDSFPSN
jgi:hypothetical protein